ncbi:distal tail protein Dit [Cytobacillus firmus]|uniref:distal tail protein Dit n=1 Tax=Cytobacillus firmus TaxID=1399 RepID=UPI001C8E3163|nr:distal tail protein Dit [Cytobacillus firmus]MBX9972542.1 phage tail family protein [Cytobacillus firmus]
MFLSFLFRGISKPFMFIESGKRRSVFAPLRRNLLSIPNMPGALLEGTDTNVRIIEQPIFIKGENKYDLRKLEEGLADWLITDQPQELIFPDEPDRVYYAVVDGSLDIEDFQKIY